MGKADLCPPCLLRHPLYVREDNNSAEVALYPHSVPLQFCINHCHAPDVGDDRFPPIKNCPHDVDELPPDVCGLWYFCPLCDSCEELMNLVLVNRFEVAVVCRLQDGAGYVFSDDLGYPLCNPFLDTSFCKAENVLYVGFVLGVTVFCDFWLDSAVIGASRSLFLMSIVNLYSLSALQMSLASPFIQSDAADYLHRCTRSCRLCSCGGRYPTFMSAPWSWPPCGHGRVCRRPWWKFRNTI